MASTISGNINHQVVLQPTTYSNPVTITGSIIDPNGGGETALVGASPTVWTIINQGVIEETGSVGTAIGLQSGGTITNTGLIQGAFIGISMPTGTVANNGTIIGSGKQALALIGSGATVTNGLNGLIQGAYAAILIGRGAGTVSNLGTVISTGRLPGVDIYFSASNTVTNGASGLTTALIKGFGGVEISGAGTVANFGQIISTATLGDNYDFGVNISGAASSLTNAAGASIVAAGLGVSLSGGSGTITNFGTITTTATAAGTGIDMLSGGNVVNGASNSTVALIQSAGAGVQRATNVTNYGTIVGTSGVGVGIVDTVGTVTNLGLITGASGIAGGATTVTNSGTVLSTTGLPGVRLYGTSGVVTNGASGSTAALIKGGGGVGISSIGTVVNFGQIISTNPFGANYSYGVNITGTASSVTNGAAGATGASIVAVGVGVEISGGSDTITKFGTITATSTSGSAVDLLRGGNVVNGASNSTVALIQSAGAGIQRATNVTNYGTIVATGLAVGIIGTAGTVTNAGLITGAGGISGGTTVTNSGTIAATAAGGIGVHLYGTSGVVTNAGVIAAGGYGVRFDSAGTVTNLGAITGTTGLGVFIGRGGSVANGNAGATGKSITGASFGVEFFIYGSDTLSNFGTIAATATSGIGVDLRASGIATNGGTGFSAALIKGNTGIAMYGTAAALTTFGTIIGTGGVAVQFGNGNNRLIVEPGAVFSGKVQNQGGSNTIELAAGAATGTLTGLGTSVVNFGSVVFDAGAAWTVTMDNPPAFTGAISGFTGRGDTIDLTGLAFSGTTSVGFNSATDVLTVTEGAASATLQLDAESYTGIAWTATQDAGTGTGTDVTIACFCRGTLILTERGEVPVEELAIGDRVVTLSGAARPIKWIGRRSYGGRFAVGQRHILPVCVSTDALADGVPRRDLWVSPNHALYLEGVLIEARDLVNGVSVVQAERVEAVEYFHIELDSHDVIVAEGAAAESFIDDDSRGLFHNAREYRALYPDERTGPARYCAPRRDQDHEVERARAKIARRAGLAATAEAPALGVLRGQIEEVGRQRICGWAQDAAHPDAAVCLDILTGGQLIGPVVANRYRADLAAAGIGGGRHGFAFVPPAGLAFTPRSIQISRSLDCARLTCSTDLQQSPEQSPARRARCPARGSPAPPLAQGLARGHEAQPRSG